ncbi:hypothetical protein H0H87_000889 [Tephrocybe sp. NHM501043]|nr:hypothetical protein H0H87_000889 [Tephrocybe sp. NHM501043]
MRAILIKDGKGPVDNLHLGEAPTPSPGPGQVLVKIKAFGVNRMDILQREGNYPPPAGSSSILGVEFSGHISALGAGVSGWKVDDEVLGLAGGVSAPSNGAYAEYIALPASHIIRKPNHLSWVEAASIPENFLTGKYSISIASGIALVLCAGLKKGGSVLVHAGASGVGVAAIQLARFLEANTVTATASTKEKLDWLLSLPLGATHVANYKTEDFSETVKKATNGKGADVVVDFVGRSHWKRNIDSLAIDGHMTMLALLSGKPHLHKLVPELTVIAGSQVDVDLSPILYKRLRIQGSTLRSRSVAYQTDLIAQYVLTLF